VLSSASVRGIFASLLKTVQPAGDSGTGETKATSSTNVNRGASSRRNRYLLWYCWASLPSYQLPLLPSGRDEWQVLRAIVNSIGINHNQMLSSAALYLCAPHFLDTTTLNLFRRAEDIPQINVVVSIHRVILAHAFIRDNNRLTCHSPQ
jgi:hypothetical protein